MTSEEFKLKKEVDKVVRVMKKLQYYTMETLDYNIHSLDILQLLNKIGVQKELKLTRIQKQALDRFQKETLIVGSILSVHHYATAPDTLDIIENPQQDITKQQLKAVMTAESNRDQPSITIGQKAVFPMSPEEFEIYLAVYNKLGYVVQKGEKV